MSELFWFVGVKFGRLSKSMRKSPCSPQPAVGVAVAEETEAETGELVADSDLLPVLCMDVWKLLAVLDVEPAGFELLALSVWDCVLGDAAAEVDEVPPMELVECKVAVREVVVVT